MLKLRKLISEGILDGIFPSFIIDSGITESAVKGRKMSLSLPRYSVWGFNANGNGTPKLMENGYNLDKLLEKHGIDEDSVYEMNGDIKETIRKVGKDKWDVYSNKGKKVGTHDNKQSAKNQSATLDVDKKVKKII